MRISAIMSIQIISFQNHTYSIHALCLHLLGKTSKWQPVRKLILLALCTFFTADFIQRKVSPFFHVIVLTYVLDRLFIKEMWFRQISSALDLFWTGYRCTYFCVEGVIMRKLLFPTFVTSFKALRVLTRTVSSHTCFLNSNFYGRYVCSTQRHGLHIVDFGMFSIHMLYSFFADNNTDAIIARRFVHMRLNSLDIRTSPLTNFVSLCTVYESFWQTDCNNDYSVLVYTSSKFTSSFQSK